MATIAVNNTYYMFTCTSANATVGATYTNNAVTYTVKKTLVAGTKLYCTALASSVTSWLTLTKVTGTGDATITFSVVTLRAHVNGITYVAGDILSIGSNCSLDINESPSAVLGWIQAISASKTDVNITNTSTTTPIVISMSTENSDISVYYQTNSINIVWWWIQIATGTGAAAQTINFTSVMGWLVDSPPCVWVETGDTRHYYITNPPSGSPWYFMPFFNCGLGDGLNATPNFDVTAINILTEFRWDLDHWPVFKYDVSTKIATFWSGWVTTSSLWGAVIPNLARVFYPNIHFTSTVYTTIAANRNLFVSYLGATVNMRCVAFSRNWNVWSNISSIGSLTIQDFWWHRFSSWGWHGTGSVKNMACAPDQWLALISQAYPFQISGWLKTMFFDFIWGLYKTTSTYSPWIQINNSVALSSFTNIWWWVSSPNVWCYPVMIESILNQNEAPIVIWPIYCIWWSFYFRECDNIHMTSITNSDTSTSVPNTLSGQVIAAIGSKNMTVAKIRQFTNSSAWRGMIVSTDSACYQFCIKDIDYDMKSNSSYAISASGERWYVANIRASNPRLTLYNPASTIRNVRISNLYAPVIGAGTSSMVGTYLEWNTNSSLLYSSTVIIDSQPFQPIWVDAAKTTARLCTPPLAPDNNSNIVTIVSWISWTDFFYSANALYVPNAGVELIYTNEYPVRGITNFTGATGVMTHTSFTTWATIEFSMRNNDGTDVSPWTAWYDATTAANFQTALATLTGYTNTKWFFIRLRLKTTTAVANRVFNYGYVTCTPNSTWTPEEIGFVPLLVSGQVNGSTAKLYDNTVPASPVPVRTKTLTASANTFDFPYNFDALAKNFKFKVRKSGYGEVISTDFSYQKGKWVPISQVFYATVNDAVASLITGIAIDGATNTITMTQNRTKDELYAYAQWWGAQVYNMDYNIPLVTTDSINYTSTFNIVLTNANLTGTANITTTGTLTITGTSTSTPIITASNGKTGYLNISGLSGHAVYLEDGSGVQKDYQASVTGTYNYFLSNVLTGTWTYKIAKYGSNLITWTFTPSTWGNIAVLAILDADLWITQATVATVVAYTTIDSFDMLYDYSAYYQTTNVGIKLARLVNKNGLWITLWSLSLSLNATAGSVFSYTAPTITIKTSTLTKWSTYSGSLITTGTVTFLNGATTNSLYTDSIGSSSILNILWLAGHSVYIENNTAVQKDYQTITGSYALWIPNTSTGTWKYVIKKPWYTYQVGTFTPATGWQFSISASTPQKFNPNGTIMYQASNSLLATIAFTGTTQANIRIWDGEVSAQQAFDMTETALVTNAGMIWLTIRWECSIFLSSWGNYLFLSDKWRIQRRTAGDVNASLSAFVTSSEGVVVDNVNGWVQFLSSSGGLTIEQATQLANTVKKWDVILNKWSISIPL